MQTKVFVVDDHELVRKGLIDLIDAEEDLTVVGSAANCEEAVVNFAALDADVAVLDVRLPDGNGIELCRDLISLKPELKVLMLTSFQDDEALLGAVLGGAVGTKVIAEGPYGVCTPDAVGNKKALLVGQMKAWIVGQLMVYFAT